MSGTTKDCPSQKDRLTEGRGLAIGSIRLKSLLIETQKIESEEHG